MNTNHDALREAFNAFLLEQHERHKHQHNHFHAARNEWARRTQSTQYEALAASKPEPSADDIHSCSPFCTRPGCVADREASGEFSREQQEDKRFFDRLNAAPVAAKPEQQAQAGEPEAWGVWLDGEPPHPWREEWFIAETIYGDRVVLRYMGDDMSYQYKTADATYMVAKNIKRWMQFPDGQYISAATKAIANKDAALQACVEALEAINKECFSHVDGRDLFAQMHPRNTLDIKRRVDARETWFEGDWLTDLWGQIKKSRAAIQQAEEAMK